jgi:hypothetical protein
MFRAVRRSLSGALTVFVASGLHTHVVTGRSQVWVQSINIKLLITLYYYTRGMAWLLVYAIITLIRNNKLVVQLLRTSLCVGHNSKGDSLRF